MVQARFNNGVVILNSYISRRSSNHWRRCLRLSPRSKAIPNGQNPGNSFGVGPGQPITCAMVRLAAVYKFLLILLRLYDDTHLSHLRQTTADSFTGTELVHRFCGAGYYDLDTDNVTGGQECRPMKTARSPLSLRTP